MLTIDSLTKAYRRKPVLEGVCLSVPVGTLNVVIGPNGAGKSTLLRLLAHLERPDAGWIRFAGARLVPEQIRYLPQDVRFHPRLTVAQLVAFYADVWEAGAAAARAALVRWGLEAHAGMPTAELSGGLRQRLGLAVLTVRESPLLLLDEPGLSLDPEWRQALQRWLEQEAARGVLVLVTTHLDPGAWERADQVWNCADRRVVPLGREATSKRRRLPGGGPQ